MGVLTNNQSFVSVEGVCPCPQKHSMIITVQGYLRQGSPKIMAW